MHPGQKCTILENGLNARLYKRNIGNSYVVHYRCYSLPVNALYFWHSVQYQKEQMHLKNILKEG